MSKVWKVIRYLYILTLPFVLVSACVPAPKLTQPTPEPTFDKNTYVFQPNITLNDNGKTITYLYGPRFTIMLDDIKYPIRELKIECKPRPLMGYISNGSCYPDCYPIMFEAAGESGTCDVSVRDFHVHIRFY